MDSISHADPKAAARRAIVAAGGGSKLAAALGVGKQAVCNWQRSRVPARHVYRVSEITGVPMRELRPDLFGAVPPPAAAEP